MNLLIGIGTWIKTHVVISVIIGTVIIGGAIATPIIISNLKENTTKQVEKNKTNIELSDNLNFEIDSDVFLISLIKKISNGELLTENEKIDTSKLGEQEITIEYLNEKEEEKEFVFMISIVDTAKPIIGYKKELTTTVGVKIDLLKDVKVVDNSKEEIKATIEGDYDINKVGTYNLRYVAVDSSNNKTEEKFSLKVEKVKVKTTGQYVRVDNGDIVYFSTKNSVTLNYHCVPCESKINCCPSYGGTYVISGNKIIITLTQDYSEINKYLDGSIKIEFVISNENQIVLKDGNHKYEWSEMGRG